MTRKCWKTTSHGSHSQNYLTASKSRTSPIACLLFLVSPIWSRKMSWWWAGAIGAAKVTSTSYDLLLLLLLLLHNHLSNRIFFLSPFLEEVRRRWTYTNLRERCTHHRRHRNRRKQPRRDPPSLRHPRRPVESLRRRSPSSPLLERRSPHRLHPVRRLRPRRREIQAIPLNRRHARLLRHVHRPWERG